LQILSQSSSISRTSKTNLGICLLNMGPMELRKHPTFTGVDFLEHVSVDGIPSVDRFTLAGNSYNHRLFWMEDNRNTQILQNDLNSMGE
jgi:hypothetical protein